MATAVQTRRWFGGRKTALESSPRLRVLTASAAQINLTDRREARRLRALRQGWQLEAWAYRDSIPELRYATNFLANCSARMKIYPAAYPVAGESDSPVALIDIPECPPDIITACTQAMKELGRGKLEVAGVMHALSTNRTIAGEGYLLGQEDPETGERRWTIRSVDEIIVYDDGFKLREVPFDPQGILGWVDLDPQYTMVSRMWDSHPRFRILADSPLRAIIDECEALLILRRDIRATGRSRLAKRKLLLIPNEFSLVQPNDDDEDPESDPFFRDFTQAVTAPIVNEGTADAAVPVVLRGPGEYIAMVKDIDLASAYDEIASKTRDELVGVIATGLDLPKEVVTGVADLNHWSAWQIDDNTFRHHVEPHVIGSCDALTGAFLRPYVQNCEISPSILQEWLPRIHLWFDPTELVTHPDQTADAFQLHDRIVIDDAALRRVSGFSEDDAPDPSEIEERLIKNMRVWPPNLVAEFIHQLDPALSVPPITVAGTVPGIKPSGVDMGDVPAPAALPTGGGVHPAATPPPLSSGTPPAPATTSTPGPPAVTASAHFERFAAVLGQWPTQERSGLALRLFARFYGRDALIAALTPPVPEPIVIEATAVVSSDKPVNDKARRLSRRLSQIDSDLRSRLQIAACAAVVRQLEKAGGRLRSKVAKDDTLRTKIAQAKNERVAAVLGEQLVASIGLSPSDLVGGDWLAQFRQQFLSWTAQAQEQALRTATQLAGLEDSDGAVTTARAAMSDGLDAGWRLLEQALTDIAQDVLYNPDPNAADALEFNPDTVVPTGVIRAALGVAGGANANDLAIAPSGEATIPVGMPIGQIGTGTTIQNLITGAGQAISAYEWIHGPSLQPYEPHLDLDGEEFTSFDSSELANDSGYPDNTYYFPGDHPGSVVAGTVIEGSLPEALSLRWYEGVVIEFSTASGKFLAVTPNHPVLTDRGWVSASDVVEGDHVLRSLDTYRAARLVPDNHQVPTAVEDLFAASWIAPNMLARGVPIATEDFHGDGIAGQIAVVTTDRELRSEHETKLGKPSSHELFGVAHHVAICLASASRPFEGLVGVRPSSLGLESKGCETASLFGRASGGQEELRIALTTWRDPEPPEALGDRIAIHAETLGKSLDALARFVELDKVIKVDRRGGFAGHVFDLHTAERWYVANGLILHNCLCDFMPVYTSGDSSQNSSQGDD